MFDECVRISSFGKMILLYWIRIVCDKSIAFMDDRY